MALNRHDATIDRNETPPRGTLRIYFVRYRLALYLILGAAAASGIAVSWSWLTAAGLIPVIAFLPCMVMMFMCMKHGTRGPDEETTLPGKMVTDRLPTAADPQQ